MKIAHVLSSTHTGGAERRRVALVQQLVGVEDDQVVGLEVAHLPCLQRRLRYCSRRRVHEIVLEELQQVVAARLFGGEGVKLTIGNDRDTADKRDDSRDELEDTRDIGNEREDIAEEPNTRDEREVASDKLAATEDKRDHRDERDAQLTSARIGRRSRAPRTSEGAPATSRRTQTKRARAPGTCGIPPVRS